MKVFHVAFSFTTGGIESLLINIMKEQSKVADLRLIVINKHVNDAVLKDIPPKVGLNLLNRTRSNKLDFFFLIKLWALILREKPDAIHCHNDNLIPLLPFIRKRCFLTLHTTGMNARYLHLYKKVFAISKSVEKEMKSRYSGDNLSVILNGIDFCLFKKKEDYKIRPAKTIRLVQVSRLAHEIKGQDLLIKAVYELNRRSSDFKYAVDFVGDGSSLEYLETLCKDLSIEKNVRFLGFCDLGWINENLFLYDILIQPSRIEGFGLTILEGIASEIPVIASKIDGPEEIMNELPESWQFAVDDMEGLINQIEVVTKLYVREEIKEICYRNREVAQRKFSIKNTALNYLAEYSLCG